MSSTPTLHIVTGKGGTGKTTVAAALAMALAGRGQKVLLCEVEGRQGIAQLFDVAPLPYEERRIATGLGGGEVYALAIDPESALLEYLEMFYRLGRAGKALDRFGIIDFATTIAPGVRDVLLTGKVYEIARRQGAKNEAGPTYDAIIMDAPPTGRITRFLNVNSEVAGLAKVGPIRRQADSIMQLLRSDATRVHLVTVLEEMPVQETLDGVAELTGERLPVGHVIVNLVRPALVTAATATALDDDDFLDARLPELLAGARLDPSSADVLVAGGRGHLVRQALQQGQRELLEQADPPMAELPLLDASVDAGALLQLAEHLRSEGVA
ncbi:Anion-transporting ATPase [Aeromicrobium marinum DSM 15272]|uniref:Anion-transporting ATPase n=1 Tax=Aeromicrobium marinum DSM 15272 TaxID=585531 RepID=E2SC78_9ACTN|nr:ArsA-related P-loop ATPase [Aeromicrobium marinum]EFQ83364.1 Anion-transporting ATPase [Aeromicrobium marinum DSM 15272]